METKKILVLCTGNSCRSQMAEAYLKHFANGKAIVYSAGVETHGLNPGAVATIPATTWRNTGISHSIM
jgi:arsenate reductase